jgi:hypothetical protein
MFRAAAALPRYGRKILTHDEEESHQSAGLISRLHDLLYVPPKRVCRLHPLEHQLTAAGEASA